MPRVTVLRHPTASDIEEALSEATSALEPPRRLLLKPNMIKERHLLSDAYRHVITQPEVIAPVLDWALREFPQADIRLADAPESSADMALLLERSGVGALSRQKGNVVTVEDLRLIRYVQEDGVPIHRVPLPGDSMGTVRVNLGRYSGFYGHNGHRYYGADYDIDETNRHHQGDTQEYMFSGTALHSDLVVNMPKLKTHKKAGITVSLKNLVGLNGNKNWLPHHSIGTPRSGGDAYPDDSRLRRLESRVLNVAKPLARKSPVLSQAMRWGRKAGTPLFGDTQQVVRSGNWWGNDTIWRMILDLNRILIYARPDGTVAETAQRAAITVVDGVVAGEGNGPEAPDPVDAGIVVVGDSFVAVDLVCAKLMGFDWTKIPHLRHALDPHPLPLADFTYDDVVVTSNVPSWDKPLVAIDPTSCMRFRPHFGWVDHIEL